MNRILQSAIIFTTAFVMHTIAYAQPDKAEINAAREVLQRTFPQLAQNVSLQAMPEQQGKPAFEQRVEGNRLVVKGSSAVALCRGVYDFVRRNHLGINSWSGIRYSAPASLAGATTAAVVSPVEHHYYLNVVTYGYTTAYWDWQRWEQEIDWMALHGIDMPLALAANEAITARVWKRLGLTDDEIANYFVGPAHLPWMRMGNISQVDGPLPQEWHTDQIALQHKILDRMRSLGMNPICPAFAGFVPKEITRIYPQLHVTTTSWGGAFHNWMISPDQPLFHTIGKMFIEEWEKEFGENKYYIADSFNEMDIPFPPKDDPKRYSMLADYGELVYNSIKAGNNNAVWVMQGWMFGYQRDIWDSATLQALVSRVPDDKMLLLDLAVDYNKCFWKNGVNWEFYNGFFGKPWVYSVIPNMGGKTGMTGILDFYANGHLDALNSPNRGNLKAIGMAPEGLENNEVVYELIADAAWSSSRIDVNKWLENYSRCRYGCFNADIERFWNDMLASVYGSFTDHPRFVWQFRPGVARHGSINDSEPFYRGIASFVKAAETMPHNQLLEADVRQLTAAYLGGKAEKLIHLIDSAYVAADTIRATALEQQFAKTMLGIDRILIGHPNHNMARWIDMARSHANGNDALANYYEHNARRIVTIWGPPVDDYSARIWSGLVRDYYLNRWKMYFEQRHTGKKPDFAAWERNWVEQRQGFSHAEPYSDPYQAAVMLINEASGIGSDN
ncbi:MAG: alpha-N-acetylglucosaminidase [Muribaculaceae bacterium]